METSEKVFAGIAAVGAIVAIVALVIAVGAKNDSQSNSEVSDQINTELAAAEDRLKTEITKDVAQSTKAGKTAAKGVKKAGKAQKQSAANADSIKQLTTEVDALKKENRTLKSDYDSLNQTVTDLQAEVKALKKQKANR